MVSEFISWFRSNEDRWRDKNIIAEIRQPESPELNATNVRLKVGTLWASLAAWDNGWFECIVMDINTKKEVIVENHKFATPEEMLSFVEDICSRIIEH
jgi:hypothetical protein